MKRLALLLLLLLVTACSRTDTSGVTGSILIGPTCPVQRGSDPCPDKPYQASIAVVDRSGREVARAESNVQGGFKIAVPPGEYTLMPQTYGIQRAPAQVVRVEPNRFTEVTIRYDSGIR